MKTLPLIFKNTQSFPDSYPVAIIFGAGVRGNKPSKILEDRLLTGVELYNKNHVRKLLLTGDNGQHNYNEPKVMKEIVMKLGVPEQDIILDNKGFRTYDSCYRALHIFGVNKAILVTQRFHLPRSLYLCQSFGIDVIGIEADRQNYPKIYILFLYIREFFAQFLSHINIYFNAMKKTND